ncbi:hypothetical protein B566_EDAN008287 [Ephemera danica]|nr:hypothetical protein B566_EDAN008287 [Ephemera danica]
MNEAVLFGAELFGKYEETLFLSVLLCAMTILPACIHLGPKCTLNLICGIKEDSDLTMVIFRNYEFSLLGAWLGACFIPLDWDRPWQEWPIPYH